MSASRILDIMTDSFFDGISGAALFGKLQRPGAPTVLINTRSSEEAYRTLKTLWFDHIHVLKAPLKSPALGFCVILVVLLLSTPQVVHSSKASSLPVVLYGSLFVGLAFALLFMYLQCREIANQKVQIQKILTENARLRDKILVPLMSCLTETECDTLISSMSNSLKEMEKTKVTRGT